MENKGSTNVHGKTKSNLLSSSNRKSRASSLHREESEGGSKEDSDFSTNVEGDRKREESLFRKRPSTVSGNSKRRSNREGSKNSKGNNNKSWDRNSAGATSAASKSNKQIKYKYLGSNRASNKANKADLAETMDSCSCLSLAIEAQQQTIATLRLLREALRKKIKETRAGFRSEEEVKENSDPLMKSAFSPGPSAAYFESSCASYLDEILQAWINLLYLITNLKITLGRIVEKSGAKGFKADLEVEKAVISQATQCVKFFSELKMKSLVEGFEENNVVGNSRAKKVEILKFEDQISSSFFSELETLSKKAKEMVAQLKGGSLNELK